MKTKLLIGLLLATSAVFAGPRVVIGLGIGIPAPAYYVAPAPVPVYAYVPPPPAYVAPAPGYVGQAPGYRWVAGYWYFSGGRRLWRAGYWAAPRVRVYAVRGWRYR